MLDLWLHLAGSVGDSVLSLRFINLLFIRDNFCLNSGKYSVVMFHGSKQISK